MAGIVGSRQESVLVTAPSDTIRGVQFGALRAECLQRMQCGRQSLTLDLRSVTVADTSIVALVIELVALARRLGTTLCVWCSPFVHSLFELCRLGACFEEVRAVDHDDSTERGG